jgi:hypothetical protein
MGGHAEALPLCRPGRLAAPLSPECARAAGSDTGKRHAPPLRRVVSLRNPVAGSISDEPSGDADLFLSAAEGYSR